MILSDLFQNFAKHSVVGRQQTRSLFVSSFQTVDISHKYHTPLQRQPQLQASPSCFYSRIRFEKRQQRGNHWWSLSASADENNNNSEGQVTLEMTNIYREWELKEDEILWKGFESGQTLVQLAVTLGRGLGGVESRLAKLRDVNSAAYERLFVGQTRDPPKSKQKKRGKSHTNSPEDSSKKKLIPVSEVLRRIQWDYQLDEADFSIVHYDRVDDVLVESPLVAPNTSIKGSETRLVDALPEHRIMAVKYREKVVWDREERLDLIFKGENEGGIETVIATYDEWLHEHNEQQRIEEERRDHIMTHVRQVLGTDKFNQLEEYVIRLLGSLDPTSMRQVVSRMDVEGFVQSGLEIFREIREDPSGSFDPVMIPMSEYAAMDLFSEWSALLPCSSEIRNTILMELNMLMQQELGESKSTPSNLKTQQKNRPLPTINESDLTETFVKGGGRGGQKINKTASKVYLVHNPTQVSVECQETRSLHQNRKLARRRLRQKLDEFYNGSQSKSQQAAQVAATKKAKVKNRNRARQKRKKMQQKLEEKAMSQNDGASEDNNY